MKEQHIYSTSYLIDNGAGGIANRDFIRFVVLFYDEEIYREDLFGFPVSSPDEYLFATKELFQSIVKQHKRQQKLEQLGI